MGLISLTKQYLAFAARTMRWAYQPGKHPLQTTIRTLVERESMGVFGAPGVQWLYSAAKARLPGVSKVMQNVFVAREQLKKLIKQGAMHTVEDWHKLPIWGNSQEAKDGKVRRIDTAAKRTLCEVGYRSLEDLTEADGKRLATWESRRIQGDERRTVRAAFMKLIANIRGPQETTLDGEIEVERFFTTEDAVDGIWRWKTQGKRKYKEQSPSNRTDDSAEVQNRGEHDHKSCIDRRTKQGASGWQKLITLTCRGGRKSGEHDEQGGNASYYGAYALKSYRPAVGDFLHCREQTHKDGAKDAVTNRWRAHSMRFGAVVKHKSLGRQSKDGSRR
ncbi:hypothetical protein R1sor_002058 [Riccia sorocarpa]|uniref:Uncharacterized protein n=1 Tax=Riccia sorocarpa TaxID=122646 RepID=A0ABD3GZC7_9MARC